PPPPSTPFPYTTLFRSTLLVLADHAGLTAQRSVDRVPRAVPDQREVGGVRGGGPREIPALLDQHFVGAELGSELLREPLAGIDLDRKSTRLNSSHRTIS